MTLQFLYGYLIWILSHFRADVFCPHQGPPGGNQPNQPAYTRDFPNPVVRTAQNDPNDTNKRKRWHTIIPHGIERVPGRRVGIGRGVNFRR